MANIILDRARDTVSEWRADEHNDLVDYAREVVRLNKRIAELEAMLRRIDDVITWETTPLGRQFQAEVERLVPPQDRLA